MRKWTQRIPMLCVILPLLIACGITPVTSTSPLSTSTPPAPTPTNQSPSAATPSSLSLSLWVAPEFAPSADTTPGALLADRLASFENEHPGIEVHIRIKGRSGEGGLLASASAASLAAPSTMPDLITLDANALNDAAALGLLIPLDEIHEIPSEPDWYSFVLGSMRYNSQTVGIPFVSETDILAFRTDLYPSAPRRIETLLAEGHAFQFPAGDPEAQFTLAQYLSLAGTLTDTDGLPEIDPERLGEVLSFYQAAVESNVLPLTVRQWTATSQTWEEIQANRTAAATVPLDLFIHEHDPQRLSGAPLPSGTDSGIGLAHTWYWGVVANGREDNELKIELLDYLMDPEFLGPWSHAMGLLPPNGASLAAWPEGTDSALVSRLVTVTRPMPTRAAHNAVAGALLEAVEAVLTGSMEPAAAAQAASDAVLSP